VANHPNRTKKASAKADEAATVLTYKGFDAKLVCRDFQYEIGGTYKAEGAVVRCGVGGFHSVGMPLDAWSYYGPATSRYCITEIAGDIARGGDRDDSKIASGQITIKAELRLPEFIKRAAEWIVGAAKANLATGYSGHAAATGYSGHAAATGNSGHAAATGDYGHAAATGKNSVAFAPGIKGQAKAATDGWIVLGSWQRDAEGDWQLLQVRTAKVGGPEGIRADTFYRLDDAGEFVAIEPELEVA